MEFQGFRCAVRVRRICRLPYEHLFPIDDVNAFWQSALMQWENWQFASAEVKDCLVKVAKVHGVVNPSRSVEGTVEVQSEAFVARPPRVTRLRGAYAYPYR